MERFDFERDNIAHQRHARCRTGPEKTWCGLVADEVRSVRYAKKGRVDCPYCLWEIEQWKRRGNGPPGYTD